MILDKQLMFSDDQAVTSTALSDYSIDLWAGNARGSAGVQTHPGRTSRPVHDVGRGTEVEVLAQVTTAFANATDMYVQLVMADDAALTSNLTVLDQTATVLEADLVAGYQYKLRSLPHGITKRYLGLKYVVNGTHNAGAITGCLLCSTRQMNGTVAA